MPPIDQTCLDPARRRNLLGPAAGKGIDAVRVSPGDRRVLAVTLLHQLPPDEAEHFGSGDLKAFSDLFGFSLRVLGGRRVTGLEVVRVHDVRNSPDRFGQFRITVDKAGDDSPYTLEAVDPADPKKPARGF